MSKLKRFHGKNGKPGHTVGLPHQTGQHHTFQTGHGVPTEASVSWDKPPKRPLPSDQVTKKDRRRIAQDVYNKYNY